MGAVWARHAMCEPAFTVRVVILSQSCSAVWAVSAKFGLPSGNMKFKTKTEELIKRVYILMYRVAPPLFYTSDAIKMF